MAHRDRFMELSFSNLPSLTRTSHALCMDGMLLYACAFNETAADDLAE